MGGREQEEVGMLLSWQSFVEGPSEVLHCIASLSLVGVASDDVSSG